MKNFLLPIITAYTLIFLWDSPSTCFAQASYNFGQRAEKRKLSRWTLSEWLAQKERNKWMDQWLSMNTPSPFEFSLGAQQVSFTHSNSLFTKEVTASEFDFAAYAKMIGLGVEYGNHSESERLNDLTGMFNLRLLGNSIQSSLLTLSYGQRTRQYTGSSGVTSQRVLRNQLAQAQLQIYLTKYFGIDANYRHYFDSQDSDAQLGFTQSNAQNINAFIDFDFFRVWGGYYREIQNFSNPPKSTDESTGTRLGIRLYF